MCSKYRLNNYSQWIANNRTLNLISKNNAFKIEALNGFLSWVISQCVISVINWSYINLCQTLATREQHYWNDKRITIIMLSYKWMSKFKKTRIWKTNCIRCTESCHERIRNASIKPQQQQMLNVKSITQNNSKACKNAHNVQRLIYSPNASFIGLLVQTCPSHWLRFSFHGSHRKIWWLMPW